MVIGGDDRARRLALRCQREGMEVATLGLSAGDEARSPEALADALALPYPFSARDGLVPCQTGLRLRAQDALARAAAGALVVAGDGLDAASATGVRLRRWDEDGAFLDANADISAEGALYAVARLWHAPLRDARCLITGYGRLARALAQRLAALGARVLIAARSADVRRNACACCYDSCTLDALPEALPGVGLVLNTVPATVIANESLALLPQRALLVELASAPYGFSLDAARAHGLRTLLLPGIPGRYAPQAAADALYTALRRMLEGGAL